MGDLNAKIGSIAVTVLSVTPISTGRHFALASVEINVDGIVVQLHGIRVMRTAAGATSVELPTFRDAMGQSRAAVVLPEAVYRLIGDAVGDALTK